MLHLQIQTSTFNMIPIADLQYIYDLARCSKCTIFILLKSTNKLYGTTEDCTSIHEIDVPFLVNTDLIFRIDLFNQFGIDIYETQEEFFIPDQFKWTILPAKYWDMYIGGDIVAEYKQEYDQFILLDKTINQPIEQIQMYKYRDNADFVRFNFLNQLENFLIRKCNLLEPELFTNMETEQSIRKAFDSKVSMGRILCNIKNERINVAFYFYKSLFSLAKADTLDIEVRFDRFQYNTFMATFKPKKKKNPLKFNKYGVPFSEKIHCMFVNIV